MLALIVSRRGNAEFGARHDVSKSIEDAMKLLLSFARLRIRSLGKLAVPAVVALALSVPHNARAVDLFKTPDEAAAALVAAVKSGDQRSMLNVLGRRGRDIISSGDEVADADARKRFVAAYEAKHQVIMDSDTRATLLVGPDDFPFPIPMFVPFVRRGNMWTFDVDAGRVEILRRRIGRNELAAIQACLAYVDAQNEYAEKRRDGAEPGLYAQRIISRSGKQDGLYWPSMEGNDESPLGELVARASSEGYRVDGGGAPFHGYYYKVLTRQGPDANGGALDYVVYGKMIGGFALVAYPARYRNSGVMTFIVNHEGTVFQKDLSRHTASIVQLMSSFNPDKTWKKVDTTALPK
jgi:hypothetical protein